jgi:AIR synthase-related protein
MSASAICEALRATRGFAHKRDISSVIRRLTPALPPQIAVGDDCAAIADGDGHLLFAIEGLVDDFVAAMPWFAGYCGVMVNVSDIYAMGGRPIAVVDALWSEGEQAADAVLAGMAEASRRYGVPIVGGHSNQKARRGQLAVAVLGRARRLLTSFDARPGDALLVAVDLRGKWEEPYPYWNASTRAPAERLRADLEVLAALAEDGLCAAAKDISMAGAVGTALMLLECSQVGARIDIDALPRPPGIALDDEPALLRWLSAFPSYGFVLAVAPADVAAVEARFRAREIACAVVGCVDRGARVTLHHRGSEALLWDFAAEPLIAAAPRLAETVGA